MSMKLLVRPESQFPPAADMELFQQLLRANGWLVIASDAEWAWRTFSRSMCDEEWADPRKFSPGTVVVAITKRLEAA